MVFFSTLKKPKHLLKKKTVHVTSTSTFIGFAPKDSAWKTEFFLFRLLLETERSVDKKKNNYRMMLFMSKQVFLPKNSLIMQEMENRPKKRSTPFLHEIFQLLLTLYE